MRTSDSGTFGVTRSQLRAGAVQHPFTGVSAVGLDLDSVVDVCRAYEPLMGPGDAFSHTTAAMLFGAPLPRDAQHVRPLHVLRPAGVTRARTSGVIGHETTRMTATTVRFGLPVVSPATMWLQLATVVSHDDLVAVGDYLVTGRRHGPAAEEPLASIGQLRSAATALAGARGMRNVRSALPLVRCGVDSRPETLVRLLLVAAGLPEPLVGAAVPVGDGTMILHPDLAYVDHRIALEYEGAGHRDESRWKRDIERRELFEDAGWRVIRITSDDVFLRPGDLVRRVRRALIARAPRDVDPG